MAGNTLGSVFCVTTWGESHGAALGAVIDGCPAGLDLTEDDIQQALDRRKAIHMARPQPRAARKIKWKFCPVSLKAKRRAHRYRFCIRNADAQSSSYNDLKDVFRPGHGDYTYFKKYGIRDWRGGGRASGRETVARVAAGAVAEKLIAAAGMEVIAYTKSIGGIESNTTALMLAQDLKAKVRQNRPVLS